VADATGAIQIHPALAEALRADRESLNQRFAQRQQAGAKIDELAFQQHLRTTVNELVTGVANGFAERVRAVVNALFDVSLDLFAAELLGTTTKHSHVSAAWREVLPRATNLLARDPQRVAGCLSNAVDHLAAQPSARPSEWIELMCDVSPHCVSVSQWLEAGKVVAWRAGLVQYRSAALRLARELPWKLAARCVGKTCFCGDPGDATEANWHERLERLENDRWYSPVGNDATQASRSLRLVRTTGGFRGFGGPCLRPPTVTAADGGLFVSDGDATWQLLADLYGTLWQRVATLPASTAAGVTQKIAIDARGHIAWDPTAHDFAELADAGSFACDGQTLAVTLPTSHHVFLLARVAT
jgi:hypothetical protein